MFDPAKVMFLAHFQHCNFQTLKATTLGEEILAGRNFGELTHLPNPAQFGKILYLAGINFGECHR